MRKRKTLHIFGISMLLSSLCIAGALSNPTKAENILNGPEMTDYMILINEEGEIETIDYDEIAPVAKPKARAISTLSDSRISYAVVYLNSKAHDGKAYLTFDNISNPGYDGYVTGSYGKDAAYIGTYNGKVRAMQSGVVMEFDARDVSIVDYSKADISHYYINDGYLYHKYFYGKSSSSAQRVGYELDYMSEGKKYYSYDGHYFYTDYKTMIDDYQDGNRNHAINSQNPYYNYFQFLSHRSKTSITASQFDNITKANSESTSKMRGLGNFYISHQNTYGVNALLMYGVSANESGWGESSIAMKKNNLFGHGAVDSNPYYGANGYETPADSIKYHAEVFISNGYLDAEDWRYNGAHLGDKSSGVNVRYASDPYWGEKAASVYYYNDSGLDDYGKYTIGIIEGVQKGYKLYQSPSTSKVVHTIGSGKSPRTYNLPVIILETVTSSGKTWYKIQNDTALNSSRTDLDYDNQYNFSRDYLYIPADNVKIVKGTVQKSYLPGDVNGDDKVSSLDYIQIKNHIMKTKVLSGNALTRADVNKDGKVSSLDYIKIKNHIMGTNKLF